VSTEVVAILSARSNNLTQLDERSSDAALTRPMPGLHGRRHALRVGRTFAVMPTSDKPHLAQKLALRSCARQQFPI